MNVKHVKDEYLKSINFKLDKKKFVFPSIYTKEFIDFKWIPFFDKLKEFELNRIRHITKRNMERYFIEDKKLEYELNSNNRINWLDSKMNDMKKSRIILILSKTIIIGYMSICFVREDERTCIYLLEIQIEQEYTYNGIGTQAIYILFELARVFKMECVMLTVFNSNIKACKFYKKLGFSIDKYSPLDKPYQILSKMIVENIEI